MDNRNISLFFIVIIAILLVGTLNVSAFGISSSYWNGNPLMVKPGETKDVVLTLVPSKDQISIDGVSASLVEGGEIAQIISGNEYSVSPDTGNTPITIRVTIPSYDPLGKEYKVKLSLVSSSAEGTGTVQLGIGYDVDFPVVVGEEEEKVQPIAGEQPTPVGVESVNEYGGQGRTKTVNIVLGIIVVIIVLIIIFLIVQLVRKKR